MIKNLRFQPQKKEMPTKCEVELENNPLKVIYSGQVLRGTVNLTFTKEKVARGVYIRVTGQGYTHWTQADTAFASQEDYFNQLMYLVGGNNSKHL